MHPIFDVEQKYTGSTVWCQWNNLASVTRGGRPGLAGVCLLQLRLAELISCPSYLVPYQAPVVTLGGGGLGVQTPSQGGMGDRTEPTLLVWILLISLISRSCCPSPLLPSSNSTSSDANRQQTRFLHHQRRTPELALNWRLAILSQLRAPCLTKATPSRAVAPTTRYVSSQTDWSRLGSADTRPWGWQSSCFL